MMTWALRESFDSWSYRIPTRLTNFDRLETLDRRRTHQINNKITHSLRQQEP